MIRLFTWALLWKSLHSTSIAFLHKNRACFCSVCITLCLQRKRTERDRKLSSKRSRWKLCWVGKEPIVLNVLFKTTFNNRETFIFFIILFCTHTDDSTRLFRRLLLPAAVLLIPPSPPLWAHSFAPLTVSRSSFGCYHPCQKTGFLPSSPSIGIYASTRPEETCHGILHSNFSALLCFKTLWGSFSHPSPLLRRKKMFCCLYDVPFFLICCNTILVSVVLLN